MDYKSERRSKQKKDKIYIQKPLPFLFSLYLIIH